jgi:hypothetical protein
MNCFVVCDLNWDNVPIIIKRLSYLQEGTRVNVLYNKVTDTIVKNCHCKELDTARRTLRKNKETEDLVQILSVSDFCMVFTDFIEYNTSTRFVIDTADANNIPCFVFSNIIGDYILRGQTHDIKFKKMIKSLEKRERKTLSYETKVEPINNSKVKKSYDEVVNTVRTKYSEIKEHKESHSIIIVP